MHYVCDSLRRELHTRDQLATIERELAELDRRMRAFREVHRARLDREVLVPLVEALEALAPARVRPVGPVSPRIR